MLTVLTKTDTVSFYSLSVAYVSFFAGNSSDITSCKTLSYQTAELSTLQYVKIVVMMPKGGGQYLPR